MDKGCKVEWCNGKFNALWYCLKHYTRLRSNGSPEIAQRKYQSMNITAHPLGRTYHDMLWRCNNQKLKRYCNYGGSWIKVCERWSGYNGFANFLEDMWPKPEKSYSIDRIDPHGNYCPENCRWATKSEQARNKKKIPKNIYLDKERWLRYMQKSINNRKYIWPKLKSYEEALTALPKFLESLSIYY